MKFCKLTFLLLLTSSVSMAQSVSFRSQPPKVGSGGRVTMTSRLTMHGQRGGTVATKRDKEVAVVATQSGRVTQSKVRYLANSKTSSLARVESERSPTEGRSYLAFANGNVTTTTGNKVSRDERTAVAEDMKVGQPNALATALNGRTLSVGATLPSSALRAMLDSQAGGSGLGKIERATARLTEIRRQGPVQLAVFALSIDTKMSKGLRMATTINLTGRMVIAAPMAALLSLDLSGPVRVQTQKGVRPLRRARTRKEMHGSFNMTMKVTPSQPKRPASRPSEPAPRPTAGTPKPSPKPQPVPSTEPIVAKWQTDQPANVVEVYAESGRFQGKLIKCANASAVGMLILRDLKKSGTGYAGKIFSPQHNRTVDAIIVIKGSKMTIQVQAGPNSKSMVWTRL